MKFNRNMKLKYFINKKNRQSIMIGNIDILVKNSANFQRKWDGMEPELRLQ